jgi:hypothetical protein
LVETTNDRVLSVIDPPLWLVIPPELAYKSFGFPLIGVREYDAGPAIPQKIARFEEVLTTHANQRMEYPYHPARG